MNQVLSLCFTNHPFDMLSIHNDYPLTRHNTFGVHARASLFGTPENIEELEGILSSFNHREHRFLVIGEGSNILFTGDFHGLVLNPRMKGIEVVEEDGSDVVVTVGAAENWDTWVRIAGEKGWYGLENLSRIPGSVGAAPVQNIGAYGSELKDHFAWLEAYDLQEMKEVRLTAEECDFGYRSSIFKLKERDRYIITRVTFRLNREPRLQLGYGNLEKSFREAGGKSPGDLRKVVIAIRDQKLPDPAKTGNAGSFFKNPLVDRTIFKCIRAEFGEIPHYPERDNMVKIPAAWLIEQAGWKGKTIGNVGTWPVQPLVIMNHGGATGKEILEFSERIREDIDRKFNVSLEREVNVV